MEPGEKLIEIVPEDDALVIEAKIKPADIAFVHPGQKAKIKLTSYDFSVYGALDGEVIDISPDTVRDDNGNVFYRVKVRTDDEAINYRGEKLPIFTGMVADVDILTGERTIMEYLLNPLFNTVSNSLNER